MERDVALQLAKILQDLIELGELAGILDTFLNAFLHKSIQHEDGQYYLHGNFNLGGTISARLSSSNPNMQNIPSTKTKYAALIKACFKSMDPDWILVGVDFASLERKIAGLLSKDPIILAPYIEGYDSHSLNSFFYFRDQMPDIVDELQGYFDE